MPQNKIFISWTGSYGKKLAEALKQSLLSFPTLECWVSFENIEPGTTWLDELSKALNTCTAAVVCLTPGAAQRHWINFEVGYLFGRLQNVKLLSFDETVDEGFLKGLQILNGYSKEDVVRLLESLIEDKNNFETWFNAIYPAWEKELEEIDSSMAATKDLEKEQKRVMSTVEDFKSSSAALNNNIRNVALYALQEVQSQLDSITSKEEISIPHTLYPDCLLYLLNKSDPTVRAIALVDKDEQFWRDPIADEIRKHTSKTSTRIFVYQSKKQLRDNLQHLFLHAKAYNVGIMSYDFLINRYFDYRYDFSLIGGTADQLLARYEERGPLKVIRFTSKESLVSQHDDAINGIIRDAFNLQFCQDDAYEYKDFSNNLQEMSERIFNPKIETYEKRTVEMSVYVDPDDYDKFEENHAYYRAMMDLMVEFFVKQIPEDTTDFRVLEFGAGTGIFTKRLAERFKGKIVAVEVDWACFRRLKRNLRTHRHVTCLNEDSRLYDPSGDFNCVFSSFADHHIRPADKMKYFANVKKNMKEGAYFIVGDEFLPDYDSTDSEARRIALKAYHNHIIDLAQQGGHNEVAELEKLALDSGLREIGDFKLTCKEYENLLKQAGLQFDEPRKIGPLDNDSIGGIYVYIIRK